MQKEYIINSETLALISINKELTKVIEENEEIIVDNSLTNIMNNSCKYFGSSLIGRQEGSKYLLGCSYKLPIIIDETRDIIFFPTVSPRNDSCIWISFNNMDSYKKYEKDINIKFKNQKLLNLTASYGSFENQYYRSLKLYTIRLNKSRKN